MFLHLLSYGSVLSATLTFHTSFSCFSLGLLIYDKAWEGAGWAQIRHKHGRAGHALGTGTDWAWGRALAGLGTDWARHGQAQHKWAQHEPIVSERHEYPLYILIHLVCQSVTGLGKRRAGHGLGTGAVMGGTGHGLGTGTVMGGTGHGTGHVTGGLGTGGLCPNVTSTH